MFSITDLMSANGTELNGLPLTEYQPATLRHGDLIRLAGNDYFFIKVIIDSGHTNKPMPTAGVYFDRAHSQFMVDKRPISDDDLAPREKELLRYLYENAGQVCSIDELVDEVWLGAEIKNAAVTKAINRLRKELNRLSPGARNYIQTVQGQGYKLERVK